MRGVVFTGNRRSELRHFPDPKAGPGEVIVKMRASGLCGTDLYFYRAEGPTETISGHEPCGEIVELGAGANPGLKLGDRVIVHHYAGCAVCRYCSMGYEQLCAKGHVTYGGGTGHGANADYMLVPARTLVHLPDELSFEDGAALSCGTGTAWNGLKKMNVSGGDIVAVFGQGPVGLSGTLCAKWMGATVIAIDVVKERLALARAMGADHVVDASVTDPVEAVLALTAGQGATAALETSGNASARSQTVTCLRPFSRACYVGSGAPAQMDINRDVIFKVATIFGSWTFSKAELVECARFMVDARVPLDRLVTDRFTLDQADDAFRLFDAGATGKCMIVSG